MSNSTVDQSSGLSLQVAASPYGEATPSTTVAWSMTDVLIEQMKERKFVNPHLILVVASVTNFDEYNTYKTTKVYSVKLGNTAAPKKYIQFSRPGTNVVIATIVDVRSPADAVTIRRMVDRGIVEIDETGQLRRSSGDLSILAQFKLQVTQKVIVDRQLFAPPPPKWLRRIVKFFYYTAEFDQCHFRKRAIASIFMMMAVQLYGIVARPLVLLYAVVAAKRDMSLRSFFALNPHQFAYDLGDSFWIYDKEGEKREDSIIPFFSPVAFVVYSLIAAVLLLPGALYVSLYPTPEGTSTILGIGRMLLATLVLDAVIATVIAVIWANASRKGRDLVKSWADRLTQPTAPTESLYQSIQKHQTLQVASREDVENIPDTTVALRFNALKAKVCRPFAR